MVSVRDSLNNGNPNSVPISLMMANGGEALSLLPKTVRAPVVGNVLVLPDNAKALRILSAYGIGTTNGYKAPLAAGATAAPVTTECSVNAAGNIVFASADAITSAIVTYHPVEGEIFEDEVEVATNVATLLGSRRALVVLSATRLAGGAVGVATPVHRPSTPTTGQVAIGAGDDGTVAFANADAVTRARIRYLAIPGIGATARKTVAEALTVVHGGV